MCLLLCVLCLSLFQPSTVWTILWKCILLLLVCMWIHLFSTHNIQLNRVPKAAISERYINLHPSHEPLQHDKTKNKGQNFGTFAKIVRESEVKGNKSEYIAKQIKRSSSKNKRVRFVPGSEFHLQNSRYLSPEVVHPHPFQRLITTRTLCPDFG